MSIFEIGQDGKQLISICEDRIRRSSLNRTAIAELESVAYQHAMPEATERQQRNTTLVAERRNYAGTPNFTAM
ncbi:hypothetical protein LMH87_011998 [Akanthomyces muscarius]|uniref:Uncharacterized protein n=1 Tax=Akanthomyces muscarius TaxID=2231603 RepID=A0A9W8QDL6_AKAMU|nr:hypothetical protein LMH87_011998 [Akanthomyces muscarius]KAJ4151288.1 hypothetical protein LMH87_011998 [Akanthomyces muscarius]